MQFERWVEINLDKGRAAAIDLGPSLFTEDTNPLKLGVRLRNSDGDVTVEGTVTGKAVTAAGDTITLTGSKDGNAAWIVVPQSALVQGKLELFLRISDASNGAVALYAIGTVKRSETDSVIVPGDPLPDVDEIREIIEAASALIDSNPMTATVSDTTLVISSI
ncbi:MAG: hypothetical protein J6V72_10190 [Kiritimatiellae bacterium]|nr:hypothetical protein [Kiritimatiellia bacterium]